MPHTKDGMEVKEGEVYNLPIRVKSVQSSADYCNCTTETVEPMFPTNTPVVIVINTKQLTAVQSSHQLQAATNKAMAEGPTKPVFGFGFPDLTDYARHAINVVKKAGDEALGVLEAGFKMFSAFTDRDLTKVMEAFHETGNRVQAVIQAIKDEFSLHEEESNEPDPGTNQPARP